MDDSLDAATLAIQAILYPSAEKPAPVTDIGTKPEAEAVAETPDPEETEAEPSTSAEDETETDAATEAEDAPEAVVEEPKPVPAKLAVQEPQKAAPEATKEPPKAQEPTVDERNLAQLNSLIPQLQAAIQGEFADLKTFSDLLKVGVEDPARYNRYVTHQAQLQHAMGEQTKLAADQHTRWYQAQVAELSKPAEQGGFPDYIDPVKGVPLRAELTAYAKKLGFDEGRMLRASASDIVTLNKALQFDKMQGEKAKEAETAAAALAKAKEKAAKAPQVQKPGTVKDAKETRAEKVVQRFKKTGRHDDLASLLIETGIVN